MNIIKIIMDLAMNIDNLDLANLVGEVMDKIMEYQNCLPKCTERYLTRPS